MTKAKKYYQGSSEVRLGEILTPKKADAEQAIKDLKAKKPFTDTARKYSADPTVKQTGGINPEFDALKDLEQSVPPIYAAVKDLKKDSLHPHRLSATAYSAFSISTTNARCNYRHSNRFKTTSVTTCSNRKSAGLSVRCIKKPPLPRQTK